MENSAGEVTAIRLDSTTPPQALFKDSSLVTWRSDLCLVK
jgi:hypothetical protein